MIHACEEREAIRGHVKFWHPKSMPLCVHSRELKQRNQCRKRAAEIKIDPNVEAVFRQLADEWRNETWFISSIKKRIAHPAYLKIIGLGRSALPLIFRELQQTPEHWYWALEAITREDPAPNAATMQDLRDAWLAWGRAHEYLC